MGFNLFNSIRVKVPKRNVFDLSHDVKFSMNMGDLVPILCEQVVPGDVWKLNTEMLMRFAPLTSPVMHRMNVYTHFFFVPNRLVWKGWQDFITGGEYRRTQKHPNEVPSYPTLYFGGAQNNPQLQRVQDCMKFFTPGSLADYLGFPVGPTKVVSGSDELDVMSMYSVGTSSAANEVEIDALPFRAYHLIWDEYYRDENLQDPVDIQDGKSGRQSMTELNTINLLQLHRRAWEKDYFTAALPWPQAGEDVSLPLHGNAPVTVESREVYAETEYPYPGGDVNAGANLMTDGSSASKSQPLKVGDTRVLLRGDGSADLSQVSAATINELRRAIRAQEFLEKSARGGQRYIEQLFSFFGVKSSDARLQRPEYLGGGKSPVIVSDVQQTSQTTEGDNASPQGNLSGQAVSVQQSHSFKRRFEEHGYIIGIMSVLPRTAYMQGMPRKFQKFDRFDYYWPQFANLGEQEILNSELYMNASDGKNSDTFGYTPRYAEYKYLPSRVCGDFRSSLAYWHMARIFNKRPNLNGDFVVCQPDDRIFAYTGKDFQKLWVNLHHNISAVRPMPVYGTPVL